MSDGVKVDYDELGSLRSELDAIIAEFDHAGARRRELQGAVGRPYGFSDLYTVAGDFESRWDDRRNRLKDNCQTVSDHVRDVIAGFQQGDADMASQIENGGEA